MQELLESLNVEQYLPVFLDGAMNVLFAIVILIVGMYVANKVNTLVCNTGRKYDNLDDTLFRFLGSVCKYIILAFLVLAIDAKWF